MAYLLFINTARRAYIVGIVVTAFAVLAASLLLGFLGPQAREEAVDYAYGCPSNYSISVFDPAQCGGVQLGVRKMHLLYEIHITHTVSYHRNRVATTLMKWDH